MHSNYALTKHILSKNLQSSGERNDLAREVGTYVYVYVYAYVW